MQRRRRWAGLPLAEPVVGTITDVLAALPQFGRQPFAMASANGGEVGFNPFCDMVYRMPTRPNEKSIPVGVVSKNYRLVDHHQVLRIVRDVLVDNEIDPAGISARADWTIHGERARFSLVFPPEDRFKMLLHSATDDQMRFRIEVFNSVEGSYRLTAVAGWLRLVCSNGLIIGTALMELRQQHRQQLQVEDLARLLRSAIEFVAEDKATVEGWIAINIDTMAVHQWADEDVRKQWNVKAAVRTLGLVVDGYDVEIVGDLKNLKPSQIERRQVGPVPGVEGPAKNLFAVSQALSWLAGQRSELAEDFEWRGQVSALMEKLVARSTRP
jgi:hypothetical protein